jgi:hypothetical protein
LPAQTKAALSWEKTSSTLAKTNGKVGPGGIYSIERVWGFRRQTPQRQALAGRSKHKTFIVLGNQL